MIGLAGKALALRRWQSTCTSSSPAQGLLEWNNPAQFLQPSKHLSRPTPRKMPLKFPAKGIIGCHFSQILPIALCTRIRTYSSVVWARDQGRKPAIRVIRNRGPYSIRCSPELPPAAVARCSPAFARIQLFPGFLCRHRTVRTSDEQMGASMSNPSFERSCLADAHARRRGLLGGAGGCA